MNRFFFLGSVADWFLKGVSSIQLKNQYFFKKMGNSKTTVVSLFDYLLRIPVLILEGNVYFLLEVNVPNVSFTSLTVRFFSFSDTDNSIP